MKFIVSFIFWSIILAIAGGIYLHLEMDYPYMNWIGEMPGDMRIYKDEDVFFFPIASSVFICFTFSFICFLTKKK